MNIPENTTLWFVYNSYTLAGRPKLEEAVMRYAHENYMGVLIAESEFDNVVSHLLEKAAKLREENKRLQPVKIAVVKNPLVRDHATIYIGEQNLALQKVKAIIA